MYPSKEKIQIRIDMIHLELNALEEEKTHINDHIDKLNEELNALICLKKI